jgi:hypothetical protein
MPNTLNQLLDQLPSIILSAGRLKQQGQQLQERARSNRERERQRQAALEVSNIEAIADADPLTQLAALGGLDIQTPEGQKRSDLQMLLANSEMNQQQELSAGVDAIQEMPFEELLQTRSITPQDSPLFPFLNNEVSQRSVLADLQQQEAEQATDLFEQINKRASIVQFIQANPNDPDLALIQNLLQNNQLDEAQRVMLRDESLQEIIAANLFQQAGQAAPSTVTPAGTVDFGTLTPEQITNFISTGQLP